MLLNIEAVLHQNNFGFWEYYVFDGCHKLFICETGFGLVYMHITGTTLRALPRQLLKLKSVNRIGTLP